MCSPHLGWLQRWLCPEAAGDNNMFRRNRIVQAILPQPVLACLGRLSMFGGRRAVLPTHSSSHREGGRHRQAELPTHTHTHDSVYTTCLELHVRMRHEVIDYLAPFLAFHRARVGANMSCIRAPSRMIDMGVACR